MEKKNEAERDWVTSAKPHGQCEGELRADITIFGSFPVTVLLDRQTDLKENMASGRMHFIWCC